jgi:hypothetical protein
MLRDLAPIKMGFDRLADLPLQIPKVTPVRRDAARAVWRVP